MRHLAIDCAKCGTSNILFVEGILSPEEEVHCSRCAEQLGKLGKLTGRTGDEPAAREYRDAIAC